MSDDTERGFLDALEATPHDDTTWLVYADWLEDRGDPRAVWLRGVADLARGAVPSADLLTVARQLRLATGLPADWTAAIGHRWAARPLRLRVLHARQQAGPEPATEILGMVEAGTVFASGGVAVPFEGGGVGHGWVRALLVHPVRPPALRADEPTLAFTLVLPGFAERVASDGVVVDSPEGAAELERRLNLPLWELELSVRAKYCLESEGIAGVRDLVLRSEAELLGIRNFGEGALREVTARLAERGLSLNMWLRPLRSRD